MLVRIDESSILPAGYDRQASDGADLVVVKSGHDHVIDASCADLYSSQEDAFIQYIMVVSRTALRHKKTGPESHEPIMVEPGLYKVVRQRESTPQGFRRIED